MAQAYEWDRGLLATDTVEFDRALSQLRRNPSVPAANPESLSALADQLKLLPGITRREFDRRFRLIVSATIKNDSAALKAIAIQLRDTSPEALNALRTLLPAELRHFATKVQPTSAGQSSASTTAAPVALSAPEITQSPADPQSESKFWAVVLIGTPEEHVRNEALLKSTNLDP